ncbi:MAG: lamin tail domain-containing protein [Bacteroidaceae bacterium]|nr:lamin tail domain-containing protein [Bacteroidaceae bacterium]
MKLSYYFSIAVLTVAAVMPAQAQITINEVLASNGSINTDPDYGTNADWIELYNAGQTDVNLGGWSVTDNLDKPKKYILSDGTTIKAGGYLLIWCDDIGTGLHAAFKLSADGEEVGLFDTAGKMVDSMSFGPQYGDISFGRSMDNAAATVFFMTPTPGAANTTQGYTGRSNQPVILTQGGAYAGSVTVTVTNDQGGVVYYTTDGSEPTRESKVYSTPLTFTKTTVLRARILEDGKMPGQTKTMTYFLNNEFQGHSLPVVSLATESDNFWDSEHGIYGWTNANNEKADFEIPVNIELYENNGSDRAAFNEPAGVKINGLYAWQLPQKMLGVYFKKKYGESKLSYQLFHDDERTEFDDFALRASGNDWNYTMFRDGLLQQACRRGGLNLALQAFRPSVVYLNGEFLGIHNIREKVNEDYVETRYGLESGTFDMIEGDQNIEAGDMVEWNHYKELWQKDLSVQANYDALAAVMDVENFTDFIVAQIYSHNTSVDHNPMAWKPKGGGVWRWIFTDGDRGFNKYGDDFADWYAKKSNMPFGSMLKNDGYRKYFCKRIADLLFTAFNPEEIQRQVTEHAKDIEPLMEQQVQRWLGTSSSYSGNALTSTMQWRSRISYLRDFCNGRPIMLLWDLNENYGTGIPAMLTLTGKSGFKFNGLSIDKNKWSGSYPTGMEITLTAGERVGYTFKGWRENAVKKLISTGNKWKYLDDGSSPSSWYAVSFDDSGWKTGASPLGYATDSRMTDLIKTTVNYGSSSSKYVTTYFRQKFTVQDDPESYLQIKLRLMRDDGAVVWINGKQIIRSNLRENFEASPLADNYAVPNNAAIKYLTYDIDPSCLHQGENTIAVEIHQTSRTSSDIIMDVELLAVLNQAASRNRLGGQTSPTIKLTFDSDIAVEAMYEPDGLNMLPDTIYTDMTLLKSKSPYYTASDVTVAKGARLTIEPGVEIRFAPNSCMIVHGGLTAQGTRSDSIRFVLNPQYAGQSWGALCFINTDSRSTLSYATMTDASQGPRLYNCVAAISAFGCQQLVLDHLNITDVTSNPIAARYSDVTLTNSIIHSRVTGDLINIKYGKGRVEHCTFIGNDQVDTDAIDFDGINGGIIRDVVAHHFLGDNSDAVDIGEQALGVVIDSLMAYNITDKGISVGQRSTVKVSNSTFIQTNMGIAVKDSCHADVDRCTFFAVATPVACYEKVEGRLGGNAVVNECILSNSYDQTYQCDARSSIRFSGSLSDGDTLSVGNLYGDPQFTSATDFLLTPANLNIGSLYMPETPQKEPVISEICYHPKLDSESEYIRIYNPADAPFDISGYILSQAFDFTFPQGSLIPAHGSAYIAANASKLTPKVNGEQVWQWTDGKLSNNGESIRLSNAAGIVVDQVSYMSVAPWPVSEQSGTTVLLLRDLNADNHLVANWSLKQYPDDVELIPAVPGTDMIYDLNGRAIDGQPRGLVIINGKLYFYK